MGPRDQDVILPNRRLKDAEGLAVMLLQEIDDVVQCDLDRKAVHKRLVRVLHANRVLWVTDKDRAALGLEPYDELGWMPSERIAMKKREREALLMMQEHIIQNLKPK